MEKLKLKSGNFRIAALMLCLTMFLVSALKAEEPEKPPEPKPEDKLQTTFGVDVFSQYVFRGVAFSRNSAVFQPSVTFAYKGLVANVWNNFDSSEKNPLGLKNPNNRQARWNETDLTFSYSREVLKNLTLTGGLIYYILDSNTSAFNSFEVYAGFGYKLPWFEFGFAAYREVGHFPGTYLQWYLSRSVDLPFWGASLDLWASWGAELSEDKAAFPIPDKPNKYYQSLHAGHLMATVNFPLGKYVKFSPKIMYWYALGGDSTKVIEGLSWDGGHNHLLGGATLSVTF